MKQPYKNPIANLLGASCTALSLFPSASLAGPETQGLSSLIPVEMNMTSFMIIGGLLLLSITMFFLFRARYNAVSRELKDIAGELSQTRDNLTKTTRQLDKTQADLKNTTTRYQGILFDAKVGMFQMDLNGKCTYINNAMQELSGLYPKKALKEGLPSALHPDDRKAFQEAWAAFTDGDKPFQVRCRFRHAKGREVHVVCSAGKVLNERKDPESYIGWVSDVTAFDDEKQAMEAHTARYAQFIDETIEGYFQLVPEKPIPLSDSPAQMAKAIMGKMILADCNETFAAMYGSQPNQLKGKALNTLQGGCGPFKNADSLKNFVASEYKLIDFESVRQDPRGNRLSLLNNVVGLVENGKLVGIWGSQRNVSQQKREKAELGSQVQFMRRILNSLPADVHVKDTRCRYLYASKKLADRTGIAQEEWIGKTIFEVMPGTPRDHDKNAIDGMKNNKMVRTERPYEARGKSGWMETIQIPLVSNDGLVEGIVGLSFEVTDRKKKEEEAVRQRKQLEQQLNLRTDELGKSRDEQGKTAIALRDATQKLRIHEAELENREHAFTEKLNERKRSEELLRRNEESLLTRQKHLEEQLSQRLSELDKETNKRKKWEELLSIKEDELRKLETHTTERQKQLEAEISLREKTEANLATSQTGLEKYRQELETLAGEREKERTELANQHKKELATEHNARTQAEGLLKKTDSQLQQTQERLKALAEKNAAELEHEVSERKAATTKLIKCTEELDELKQQFSSRIEAETKSLKNELAQRQIREKALRQHEKDLDGRIKELEKTLQAKVKEHDKQIQAREGAEVQRQQMESKLDQMTSRQKALVERETQKLNLNIAEIRLEEVRLRKAVGELQQTKEDLENLLKTRNTELADAGKEQQKLTTALSSVQAKLEQLTKDQSALVAKETAALQAELKQLKAAESALLKKEEQLKADAAGLEASIQKLTEQLKAETGQREGAENKLNELQIAFDASQNNVANLLKEKTRELTEQIQQHQQNETQLKKAEAELEKQAGDLQKTIDQRTDELAEARKEREKAELELVQTIERSGQNAKEIEASIASIKEEHQKEIERIKDEQKDILQSEKHYRALFQTSADAFLQLDPKTGRIHAANLAAANLFGEENSQVLVDKTLNTLSPEQQPDETPSNDMAKARLHTALETGHCSFEWQFQRNEEETFHALASLSTIEVEEKQLILAVVQDISDIKRRQSELQQTIDEAHAANRLNSKVVDEVTEAVHSSLSPVVESSAIIGKSESLNSGQQLKMATITHNCRTLIDMMNYRRELSHVADGSDETGTAKCDLHELIKDLDEQFCERAETKKLFFAVSYAQYQSANNVPKLVETDENKVRKILGILLGYALSHTNKGRIGLHASRKACKGDEMTLAFELAYTGASKQDEVLSRVFTGETNEADNAEGMKYGLTLARRYVGMLGGEISLEYRQGDVTALTIDLPVVKVASEIVMPGKEDEKEAGAA